MLNIILLLSVAYLFIMTIKTVVTAKMRTTTPTAIADMEAILMFESTPVLIDIGV